MHRVTLPLHNGQWFPLCIGVGIYEELKYKIAQMYALGFHPLQIMQEHTKDVKDLALANGVDSHDMFLLSS